MRRRKGSGLDAMVLPELKQLASLGLKGTGAMRKGQLIDAIQTAQTGCAPSAQPQSGPRPSRGDPEPPPGGSPSGGPDVASAWSPQRRREDNAAPGTDAHRADQRAPTRTEPVPTGIGRDRWSRCRPSSTEPRERPAATAEARSTTRTNRDGLRRRPSPTVQGRTRRSRRSTATRPPERPQRPAATGPEPRPTAVGRTATRTRNATTRTEPATRTTTATATRRSNNQQNRDGDQNQSRSGQPAATRTTPGLRRRRW